MSLKAVTEFIKKVGQDEELYASIKKLDGRDFPGLLRIAANAGHVFSEEQWRLAASKIAGTLSDEDLDQVVGGAISLNTSSFKIAVSPVLQTYMKPFNPLAAQCGASCSCCYQGD